jgi:HAMP domain-containing protein
MRKYVSTTVSSSRPLTVLSEVADKYNVQDWSTDFEQGETEVLAVNSGLVLFC